MIVAMQFLTQKVPVSYSPGEYYGHASGMADEIWVKVSFSDSEITNIEIIDHNEHEGYCEDAMAQIPSDIINAQSTNINAVSGATISSDAIKAAVDSAISQARGRSSIVSYKAPYEPLNFKYIPGTYTATVEGYNGDMTLTVVFSENAIESITVKSDGDGEEYLNNVRENLIAPMLKWQTNNVDSISGATWTSLGVKNAFRICLDQAKK